jgi:hypothetical protein
MLRRTCLATPATLKAMFRRPASSLTQVPCNGHTAIAKGFAPQSGKHACCYPHGNTTSTQPDTYSHSYSFVVCSRRFDNTIDAQTCPDHLLETTVPLRQKKPPKRSQPARASHKSCLSSPAPATVHGNAMFSRFCTLPNTNSVQLPCSICKAICTAK